MLTWLNTAAAWWLLLLPALLGLYILRQRPVRRRVPSLRLWAALPQVEQARPRLRRPPLSLVLLLQALLLLAGAFALMQPALTAPAGRHTVILLDASGSMQAADGSSSRFERAKEEAGRLIGAVERFDEVTVLRVAGSVETVCASCRPDQARRGLAGLQPGAGGADVRGALGIAAELAQRWGQDKVDTILISDGAFEAESLDLLPASLRFVRIGGPAENRAITVVSARQPPDGTPGYSVYARVENFGSRGAAVEVTSLADTIPQPARRLNLPAGGHADLIWQLPAGTRRFTVGIGGSDALAADDEAVLMLPAGNASKVWISVPGAELYLRALSALPGLQPLIGAGGGDADAAIAIVAGSLPDPLPAGGILLVDPDDELLPSLGVLSNVRPLPRAGSHPLLEDVDLQALQVTRARRIERPDWLDTLVESPQGPLLMAGVREGRRVAVLTFDPRDSNLTKLAAFPLLMANMVDWLYPLSGIQALAPGDAVQLQPGARVTTPGGRSVRVGDSGVFAATEEAGLYRAQSGDHTVEFAVNMTDARESRAEPRDHPDLAREAPPAPVEQLTQQQFWSPLAALALILLAGEWLYYCLKRGRG